MKRLYFDLLQFHWWDYRHPGYIDALEVLTQLRGQGHVGQLGVTNFDTDHLRLLVRSGIPLVSNQVSLSLLDRRAAGRMSAYCLEAGVRLIAYGTLAGGFISERWAGQPEPEEIGDWSKSKYKRFIDAIGGWAALQVVLGAASQIAHKHGVSLSAVALRWVLDQPAVAAAIVGARLGEREHRAANLAVFKFRLDADDHARLDDAFAATRDPPGDCGDEYRKPPFLTASGDLSHHLSRLTQHFGAQACAGRADAARVDSGTRWEALAGYSRAVRRGQRILVSGTTATHGSGRVICPGDAQAQTVYILDRIGASLQALGAGLEDVVRTRVYLINADDCDGAARVHGRVFAEIRPANTLVAVAALIGEGYVVEIEAEAELAY
jgi:diketogulonate reductase-like aldo/keto reductase/enamine deaminase RidA (YjgF/YER057c/UK114 family)